MRRRRAPERSDVDAWHDAALQMVAVFPEAGLALGPTLAAWSEHGFGHGSGRPDASDPEPGVVSG